jgi:hypothetical protein
MAEAGVKERAREEAANSPEQAAAAAAVVPGRRWRRALGLLAAAAAVIAGALVAASGCGSPARQAEGSAPSAAASLPATRGISPTALPGAPSPYRVASSVTTEPAYLDCVTEPACYAWFTRPARSSTARPGERTSDGGVTWQQLASLPDGQVPSDMVEPSCPAANTCVAVTQRDALAITSDGGAGWRLDPLPAAAGSAGRIDQVSCATARECVAHIAGGLTGGTFPSTRNGGLSWTAATRVPSGAPGSLELLRCDPGGRCTGAVLAGQGTTSGPGIRQGAVVMRSADLGLTWSVSDMDNMPREYSTLPRFLMSCGDALHCLYAHGSGTAITGDGGLTWQPASPAAWQDATITSVSCPEALDCPVALAPRLASQHPVIETTSDGTAWTAQPLPSPPDDPLQYATLLSRPVAGGCAGLASTLPQERPAFLNSRGFSTGIVQTSPQLLISSLGG